MTQMLIVGGTGETGSWFARYFKDRGFRVSVWGPSGKVEVADKLGVDFAHHLEDEVRKSDILLLSVPIKETVQVIEDLAPLMKPGGLLMDVTSLKSDPMKAMRECAPQGVEVLGSHPMFGPTMRDIVGQTVILVPEEGRCERWLPIIKEIFEGGGANVEILSADDHDEIMAVVQALTHFAYISVGATLKALNFDVSKSRKFMSPVYELSLIHI